MSKRILIVDDEPHLIRSLSFVLSKAGYEITTAGNGEEALLKVAEKKPDMMFLDIMMPLKNGYEVCETLRKIPEMQDIYIIMLSAKGWDADKAKGLSVGANDFMTKPFSPLEVVAKVKTALESSVPARNLSSVI